MAGGNGKRIGLALGDQGITGVLLGRHKSIHAKVALGLDPGGGDPTPELDRAFKELKAALEEGAGGSLSGATAYVALLPPLCDARLIPFPATMQASEVEAVLRRDVARYFLGSNRQRVVGVRTPRGRGSKDHKEPGAPVPVLAAAAPLSLLEAVRSAAEKAGWEVRSFTAAHQAWLSDPTPSGGPPPSTVVGVVGTTAFVLRLDGSDPSSVRKAPVSDFASLWDTVAGGSGPVLVLADSRGFAEVGSLLERDGLKVARDPAGWPGVEEATAARAAASGLELLPPSLLEERRGRSRKTAARLGIAAAALVIGSLGVNLWGARRELASVRGERAAIRGEVAPLLLARDSLDELRTRVQTLEEVSRSSPVWTRSLVELTALLPENTYLTGFFASGDTVELEAAGADAGSAIQALREAGLFQEIRLQGLVERELEEGETVEERFSLWARLPDPGREGGGT